MVQPEDFIHKKKRLREEGVSQNPSRRRGPRRAASSGHVPRLRGTRTELRGRWCVRRPGAAPRYRPAGERDTTPGTLRSAPARAGRRRTDWVSGPWPRVLPTFRRPRALAPTAQGNARRGRNGDLRMSPLSFTPFPLAVHLSLPVTFLSSCPPLISLSHLRSKGAPGTCVSPGPDRSTGSDSFRSKFLG